MNIETYILFPDQFSNHFRRYFQNFANNIEGKNYFLQFIKKISKLEFHPFKAYILHFS